MQNQITEKQLTYNVVGCLSREDHLLCRCYYYNTYSDMISGQSAVPGKRI